MAMTSREYHERTKHSPASVRASAHAPRLGQPAAPVQGLPGPRRRSRCRRDLPGSQRLALDGDRRRTPPHRRRALDVARAGAPALLQRRRAPAPDLPRRRDLLSRRGLHGRALPHRRRTSCAATLAGLAAGVYHFGPHDFALRPLRDGRPPRAPRRRCRRRAARRATRPSSSCCTSTFWRNAWKYRDAHLPALLLGRRHAAREPARRRRRRSASRPTSSSDSSTTTSRACSTSIRPARRRSPCSRSAAARTARRRRRRPLPRSASRPCRSRARRSTIR